MTGFHLVYFVALKPLSYETMILLESFAGIELCLWREKLRGFIGG